MRDKIKDFQYFKNMIDISYKSIDRNLLSIKSGDTPEDMIPDWKGYAVQNFINIIKSKYSAGYAIGDLTQDVQNAIELVSESWDGFWRLEYKGRKLHQYGLGAYDHMLWLLSLGYLLDIEEDRFKKLVEIIDQDQVRDNLFEFIIQAKVKDRPPISSESYEYGLKLFGSIRKAITEADKNNSQKLVKKFACGEWYMNHRSSGWYNSHNIIHNIYFGYWSFETAAVVKIMGLDDSSFRYCKYYPGDLVHGDR
ncbi:MAG: DUF1911 domain-containing protein [Saprospiraceae bacterium]|nr:DUF1911 domain-containing protein [Saprospiraceae bacterium]MBK7606490.1 DUF1911 domain-containing protein [Saprospiraceae bacterium]MBK8513974.1 DUF1911 domain-containing protein [Saprospiraceae bacterium]MBP7800810.1 DUF1911 domain-containing protein [Saprospiraceae bacterium]